MKENDMKLEEGKIRRRGWRKSKEEINKRRLEKKNKEKRMDSSNVIRKTTARRNRIFRMRKNVQKKNNGHGGTNK